MRQTALLPRARAQCGLREKQGDGVVEGGGQGTVWLEGHGVGDEAVYRDPIAGYLGTHRIIF